MATQTERQKIRDEHPDSWIAVNEGDTIMGKVVDVTEAWSNQRRDPQTGKQGSWYPLLVVQVEDATGYKVPIELKVHGFGAVLFNEIMRKQPQIGERIRIVYKGTGEAKQGQNPPELYVVRAEAGAGAAQRAYDRIAGTSPHTQQRGSTPPQGPGEQQELAADDIPF